MVLKRKDMKKLCILLGAILIPFLSSANTLLRGGSTLDSPQNTQNQPGPVITFISPQPIPVPTVLCLYRSIDWDIPVNPVNPFTYIEATIIVEVSPDGRGGHMEIFVDSGVNIHEITLTDLGTGQYLSHAYHSHSHYAVMPLFGNGGEYQISVTTDAGIFVGIIEISALAL